jgi:prolyl oligopeptidase
MFGRRSIGVSILTMACATLVAQSRPPVAPAEPFRESFHGVDLVDPYHWLEAVDSSRARQWIAAQNDYARRTLDAVPIRTTVSNRLTDFLHYEDVGRPVPRNGYFYFSKRPLDSDAASLYRRKIAGGADELLLDIGRLRSGQAGGFEVYDVSRDGALVSYLVRQGGEDEAELRVLDVTHHRDLPDRLPKGLYSGFAFKRDGRGFFYAVLHRETGQRLYYHALGSPIDRDVELFGAGIGADTWIAPLVSDNGRYLAIVVQSGWARADLYLQNLERGGPIRPVARGLDALFSPIFAGDLLLLRTDWNAPNGRVLSVDVRRPEPENWKEIVPARADPLQDAIVINNELFVTYLHNVTSRILRFSLDGRPRGEIPLPAAGVADISGLEFVAQQPPKPGFDNRVAQRADQKELVYSFSSFTTPTSFYRYDTVSQRSSLWHRNEVPFRSEQYETEQVWYASKDGTQVPMFLVHRQGVTPNGQLPTILYGYGGFGLSVTPSFRTEAAWWIEQGGVYAVANIRGGGEFGEAWHRAGMLDKKQNAFDDFIAAGEWLIAHRYTSPTRLAIWGGSNGGLLVAAALTQRPDLFQAVVCWHPDLDMVRYFRYTKNNNPPALFEYGNGGDPTHFGFLRAYSPYERVALRVNYPAVLLESGDADTRVPPEQAVKMAARLQAASSSDRPVLLLYDAMGGHSAGDALSARRNELTNELTFVAWQLAVERSR